MFRTTDPSDGREKLFLAARPSGTATTSAIKIPVGCPVPPGWSKIVPTVTKSQLVNTPTFTLSADKKTKLKKAGATERDQLLASLKGFKEGPSSQKGELSFKTKSAAENTTEVIDTLPEGANT